VEEVVKKNRKKLQKKQVSIIAIISTVFTILAAIYTIKGYYKASENTHNDSYEMDNNNNNGIIIDLDNNEGNIIIDSSKSNNNISLIAEDILDLSCAGFYPKAEECIVVDDNQNTYYKKGLVLNTQFNNESNNSKIITNINFAIDSISELNSYEIDFIPIDFEDGISIYAINNGNVNINNYCMELSTTFNDIWDGNNDFDCETKDNISLDLAYGEVKEIHQYSYSELVEIFGERENWLHVFATNTNNKVINFESFICNIVCDIYNEHGFSSIINQGGDGLDENIVPIFVDGETLEIELLNKNSKIENNGVTEVQFLILPNKSMKLGFHLELTFSDNTKSVTQNYNSNILVPIYDDEGDYYLLGEALKIGKNKRILYRKDDIIDSSFIYNPKKFYDEIFFY
jgi:hypothetical protein